MTKWQGLKAVTLASVMAAVAVGCGKQTKSQKAKISVIPDQPIVITADADFGDEKIKAPWFSLVVSIDNQSDDKITIIALEVDVTSVDQTGAITTKTVAFTPSKFDYSTDSLKCEYSSFGTWSSGENKALQITGSGSCNSGIPIFGVGGLQKSSNKNYRFRAKARPIGWFGTFTAPTDRYENFKTFTTQ
ncbi:MAG: hypothetical protein AB7F86_17625 [Bdellovibrionales bacterium]